ncbi:protein TolR [bacterium]|nr:protein TolR [bacterium]
MALSGPGGEGPVANINVTPLVDVMLVLLIIFMVTAPMLQQGVEVNLPKATTAPLQGDSEQVVLSVDSTGKLFLGSGNEVPLSQLADKVKAVMLAKGGVQKIYIQGDTAIDYGTIMEVMGRLHRGGITQIGLISDPAPPQKSESKRR